MAIEITAVVEVVFLVDHDGPVEDLDAAKYDALLDGGLKTLPDKQAQDLRLKLTEALRISTNESTLGWIDDNVSYSTLQEIACATVTEVTRIEHSDKK